jgi:hypothetical protein
MPLIEVGGDLPRFIASEQAVRFRAAVVETDAGQSAAKTIANYEAGSGLVDCAAPQALNPTHFNDLSSTRRSAGSGMSGDCELSRSAVHADWIRQHPRR